MEYQIIAIHLNQRSKSKKITKVRLSNGEVQTAFFIAANLMNHDKYYYVIHDAASTKFPIKCDYTIYGTPFIKTVARDTNSKDDLLKLPKF